jgi:cyclohexyl-isocyanide hydratase
MVQPIKIGFLLFPNLTQLDLTGPYEVFARLAGAEIFLVWKNREPVRAQGGISILPSATFAGCPQLDLICIPGGPGTYTLLTDEEALAFVQKQAKSARYVTSVCTGALLLGAAGLLEGRRATTHWMSMELLKQFGATPINERVVIDGNVITGGGVTAGIDFALKVVAELASERMARSIQLSMEYDPQPPFDSGHPRVADPKLVEGVTAFSAKSQVTRNAQVEKAAARLQPRSSPARRR